MDYEAVVHTSRGRSALPLAALAAGMALTAGACGSAGSNGASSSNAQDGGAPVEMDGGSPTSVSEAASPSEAGATDAPSKAETSGGESPRCTTVVATTGSIVDAAGNTWTLAKASDGSLMVDENGVAAGFTDQVIALAYVNHVVSQENVGHAWWSWSGGAWVTASDPTIPCNDGGGGVGPGNGAPQPAGRQNAFRTADFIDIIGVNTHLDQGDTYGNTANVIANLKYLGVHNIREGIRTGAAYTQVAQAGIRFTAIPLNSGSFTSADIAPGLAPIEALAEAVPGSVLAIEGPNEINNWPVTYAGVGGLQGAENLQKDLYAAVKADVHLKGVVVDYFTDYQDVTGGPGVNPHTTAGYADFDNAHPYPPGTSPPDGNVDPSWYYALGNESAPFGPAVYTELGYAVLGGSNGTGSQVSADIQARYTLDIVADAALYGLTHVFLYQLMDESFDTGFGLFDQNGAARPAATAVHDLLAVLADTGPNAYSFTPAPVAYTVSSLPNPKWTLTLQKSTGENEILLWNEASATPVSVTVNLPKAFQTVAVFDPMMGTTAAQTHANASSVTVAVSNYPMIVQTSAQ